MKVDPISSQDFQQQGAAPAAETFTNEQKRDELAREINLRNVVYPGQIRAGRLTQEKADRQTAILRAIWQEYDERAKADKAKVQPQLALGDTKPAESESIEAEPQKQADAPVEKSPEEKAAQQG